MSRALTPALEAALLARRVRPAILNEIETAAGFLRVWSGVGDLVFGGNTFTGIGEFGGFSEIAETEEVEATGIRVALSGVPSAILSTSLGDIEQGRSLKLWIGAFDLSTELLIVDPFLIFEGLTDVPEIDDTGEMGSVAVSAESRLIKLETPITRRYTDFDQRIRDPDDRGFEFVPSLQDKQIRFGGP